MNPNPNPKISEAVRVLNQALCSDPKAIRALLAARVPCNDLLAANPTIQVAPVCSHDGGGYTLGVLGLINGIVEALTGERVAAMTLDSDRGDEVVIGFKPYESESVPCGIEKHSGGGFTEPGPFPGTEMETQATVAARESVIPAVIVAPYGYCPKCGAPGVGRERRPNGNDRCRNGHVYPSSSAITATAVAATFTKDAGAAVFTVPAPQPSEPAAWTGAEL